jgi:hypothetical protein
MDLETLQRAADGDPEAIRQLKAWLAMATEEAKRDLEKVLEKEKEERRRAFWAELRDLQDSIGSAPLPTAPKLDEMEERGRSLGTCEVVQVTGLRSARSRLLGDLDGAEELLGAAYALAPQCRSASAATPHLSPCLLDLDRRSAILEAARGRPANGLRLAQTTLDGYEALGNPGHDIDGNGVASAHYTRAEMRFELHDFGGAAADFAICVDTFPNSSKVWQRAHQNLASALSKTGAAGRREAYKLMGTQRMLIRIEEASYDKAAFWWLNGQLTICFGNRTHGMAKLRESLDDFAGLGLTDPFTVLARDIAWIHYPQVEKIHEFLTEIWPVAKRLIRDRRQQELFNEIVSLTDPHRPCRDPLTRMERLYRALIRIRELVACDVPCLVDRRFSRLRATI